jgi:hypothetical protein
LLRLFDEHNFRTKFFKPSSVCVEVALQSEDPDSSPGRRSLVVSRWQRQILHR